MPQGKLPAFIVDYLSARGHSKLETFDKEAEKRRTAGEDNVTLAQERREIELRYMPVAWLTNAANRAGQISLVTHAAKYTHGDSKSSNVYSDNLTQEGYLSTAALAEPMADAVGNAAALDVAKLLQTEVEGDSLLACLRRGDDTPLRELAPDKQTLAQWMSGFGQALATRDPASHKLAKQIYFPVADGYHLLSPLFATSLAHALHQKMVALRFGDMVKAQWQARRDKRWHPEPLMQFPDSAEMNFGGTKPQNISALNSARGGRVWLLSAKPPVWKSSEAPPYKLDSLFAKHKIFDRKADATLDVIAKLIISTGATKNHHIRRAFKGYVDELIDMLFDMAFGLQRRDWQGWSIDAEALKPHQKLWLDPWRARSDAAFREEREQDDWQQKVADDFARWFNARLSEKFPDVGKVEFKEWATKPLLRQRLREMEAILKEAQK